jgi:hypothetical protein
MKTDTGTGATSDTVAPVLFPWVEVANLSLTLPLAGA